MATKHKSHKGKTHKSKSHKSHKKTMKSTHSSSGSEMSAWCVHERKPCTMINGNKKVITMKNGNKRAMMQGMCKSCGKKVTKFVKM
jgi:hypothetical protein